MKAAERQLSQAMSALLVSCGFKGSPSVGSDWLPPGRLFT